MSEIITCSVLELEMLRIFVCLPIPYYSCQLTGFVNCSKFYIFGGQNCSKVSCSVFTLLITFFFGSLKMPRYDDRYGNTRLYVGRLASRTRSRDLERLFSRYGR